MNNKRLEKGEFILVKDTMFYIKEICKCSQCKLRGVFEPITYNYKICNLPESDGYPSSYYWVEGILPEITKRTSNRNESWVREFLEDADKQLMYDYQVIQKERLRINTLKFVDLEEI